MAGDLRALDSRGAPANHRTAATPAKPPERVLAALRVVATFALSLVATFFRDVFIEALAEVEMGHGSPPPALMTRADLARELGCSIRQVDLLRKEGLPGMVLLGDSPRWPREELPSIIEWLRSRSRAGR